MCAFGGGGPAGPVPPVLVSAPATAGERRASVVSIPAIGTSTFGAFLHVILMVFDAYGVS
jgi:hypothetical protein